MCVLQMLSASSPFVLLSLAFRHSSVRFCEGRLFRLYKFKRVVRCHHERHQQPSGSWVRRINMSCIVFVSHRVTCCCRVVRVMNAAELARTREGEEKKRREEEREETHFHHAALTHRTTLTHTHTTLSSPPSCVMSYREPSGSSPLLSSAEFSVASLRPFSSAFLPNTSATDFPFTDDDEFVREWMENVLLKLTAEKWEEVNTTEENTAHSTAAANTGERTERLTVYNIIIAQLDAILRHPAVEQHFSVEFSSVSMRTITPQSAGGARSSIHPLFYFVCILYDVYFSVRWIV